MNINNKNFYNPSKTSYNDPDSIPESPQKKVRFNSVNSSSPEFDSNRCNQVHALFKIPHVSEDNFSPNEKQFFIKSEPQSNTEDCSFLINNFVKGYQISPQNLNPLHAPFFHNIHAIREDNITLESDLNFESELPSQQLNIQLFQGSAPHSPSVSYEEESEVV